MTAKFIIMVLVLAYIMVIIDLFNKDNMYSLQPKLRSDTPSSQYALYSGECIHAFGKNRTVASPRTWILLLRIRRNEISSANRI